MLRLAVRAPAEQGRVVDKQIFVSYSHRDKGWLERLLEALAPHARREEIDVWADTMIAPGEAWENRISEQVARSNVAVLLVSTRFLASEFITDVELPRVLDAVEQGFLTLAWLPVSASAWEVTELRKFQAVIDPSRPLDQMSDAEADQALVTIAGRIAGARTLTDVGRTMHLVDEAYDGLAEQAGQDPRMTPYRVVARNTGTAVAFEDRGGETGVVQMITAADLAELPDEEHRLIRALQTNMYNEYERWTALYPRRTTLTAAERGTYDLAGQSMCKELGRILDFIEIQLGKSLSDHYAGVRYACMKLVDQAH
jgi:TIR domain